MVYGMWERLPAAKLKWDCFQILAPLEAAPAGIKQNPLAWNFRVIIFLKSLGTKGNEMKFGKIPLIIAIILSITALTSVHAASLRCGVRLITEGDFKAQVLAECGEPDHVEVWEEERVYRFHRHPGYYGIYENYDYSNRSDRHGKPYRIRQLVVVERWTYNHGPGRFMDHLRLENGIVRHITSGDYGF